MKLTVQIDMIYLKIFTYFGLHQNHLQIVLIDGFHIKQK